MTEALGCGVLKFERGKCQSNPRLKGLEGFGKGRFVPNPAEKFVEKRHAGDLEQERHATTRRRLEEALALNKTLPMPSDW